MRNAIISIVIQLALIFLKRFRVSQKLEGWLGKKKKIQHAKSVKDQRAKLKKRKRNGS